MKLRILEDEEALAWAAAEHFVEHAREAIHARLRFDVALAGGNTPRQAYALLASAPFREKIDWSGVQFFWGDEREVSPDDPRSNFRMVHDVLLEPLGIDPKQVHRMVAATEYERELRRCFAVAQAPPSVPVFDLVLLGLGKDGHTASLFSETRLDPNDPRWVIATEAPDLKTHRISLTAKVINAARQVSFLVAGSEKASILSEVLEGERSGASSSWPVGFRAQLIRPEKGQLLWLVDKAAASGLRNFLLVEW